MRTRSSRARKCPVCGLPSRKHGKTAARAQRWRCTDCELTFTAERPDITEEAQWRLFHSYIGGKTSQDGMEGTKSGRSLRRELAWCWTVPAPRPVATGQIYDQLFIDGTQIAYGWTLLIAANQDGKVVAWQWATSENSAAYQALIRGLAPPRVVTVDGAKGALKAIQNVWGDQTRVQRCLLHIHRNNTRDLTNNPQTNAGKALLALSRRLLHINTINEAGVWEGLLNDFAGEYSDYLKERTYARDDPETARIRGRKWWYTHDRDRRVYYRLARLVRSGTLFTYLDTSDTDGPVKLHSTTNIVESINARVNDLAYQHRGLSEPHLTCAIEWLLHRLTETPEDVKTILKHWNHNGRPTARILPRKHQAQPPTLGPQKWGNHATSEEGLYTRKGWAGRWQP